MATCPECDSLLMSDLYSGGITKTLRVWCPKCGWSRETKVEK